MHKIKILVFVHCYLPAVKYGGPVQSISNMVANLSDQLDFYIVTSDRDWKDTQPYPNIDIDSWNTVGSAKVFYVSPKNQTLRFFARLLRKTPYDVLYLNSFFDPYYTQRPLLAAWLGLMPRRPIVVSPRGEFSEGALALKAWKKSPYIAFVKKLGFYDNITWQASSEYEAEDIRRSMGKVAKKIVLAIVLAPDMPSDKTSEVASADTAGRLEGSPLRVSFLSRVCPKKNLDYALRVLAKVKAPVVFDIYGVAEDAAYWKHCQRLIKNLPAHVVVRYHGMINHAKVIPALASSDLFFFPTRGENYGHVIFEALAAGLPVLISDQTPWRNLASLGVGWDLPLAEEERFCAVIEAQAALTNKAMAEQRLRARQYAKLTAADDQVLKDNLNLFRGALTGRQIILPYLKE